MKKVKKTGLLGLIEEIETQWATHYASENYLRQDNYPPSPNYTWIESKKLAARLKRIYTTEVEPLKKALIVADEPKDGTPSVYSPAKRNARLLFCMDYIMHALNDEEAISDWLAAGVPDGTNEADVTFKQLKPYLDLDVSDADFDRMVGIFIRTLALQGGYEGDGERTVYDVGKAVLA